MKHLKTLSILALALTIQASVAAPPSGMVSIPGGNFMMGKLGANPGHYVELSPYYMDQTEVSKALWDTVDTWGAAHGYDIGFAAGKAANHPAQNMQWHSAVKWCNARSEMDGLTPCYRNSDGSVFKTGDFDGTCDWTANGYRLPTDAEWEFAARGTGSDNYYPWTDSNQINHSRANYKDPAAGYHPDFDSGGEPYTSPTGSFAPNTYGLYDMAGNVFEWVWDWYNVNFPTEPILDPTGFSTGQNRVIRGGSWGDASPVYCLVAMRTHSAPNGPVNKLGFRCVKAAGTDTAEPSGFAAWVDEHGLSGDLQDLFAQDHDDDGIINGLEYAFGENLTEGMKTLCLRVVAGRVVAETPMQDPDTAADVVIQVEFNHAPAGGNWAPAVLAGDTTGKPANCSWWEQYPPSEQQAFFRLTARLIN